MILSAGANGSPHILQLSGVGDPEHLGKIGVPVAHELRSVGKNMQDHYVARVSYPVVGAQTANERSRGLPLAGEVMCWLFTGKGMLTYSPSIVAASVKVLEELATPDVQCTFASGSFKNGQIGELEETPGLSAGAWQMRPLSRGYVEAKSNRPGDAPAINPRYLSEESDRRAIVHDGQNGRSPLTADVATAAGAICGEFPRSGFCYSVSRLMIAATSRRPCSTRTMASGRGAGS